MLQRLYKYFLILGITIVFSLIPVFWFSYATPNNLEVDYFRRWARGFYFNKDAVWLNILII